MIPSNDGQIRGAKVLLGKARNVTDWPVNRLYSVEMRFQFVLKDDRKSSGQKEETKIKPKRNAGDLAKIQIKNASDINWRKDSVKYFWHFLNFIDKTHAHCSFQLSWNLFWKYQNEIFWLDTVLCPLKE